MFRGLPAHWLGRALRTCEASSTGTLLSLRPAVRPSSLLLRTASSIEARFPRPRASHTEAVARDETPAATPAPETPEPAPAPAAPPSRKLPLMCSGCGAFSQTDEPQQLGFFDAKSKRVRTWLHPPKPKPKSLDVRGDQIVAEALKALDESKLKELGLDPASMMRADETNKTNKEVALPAKPPLCDRCHNLIHYSTTSATSKVAMFHPTVESLRETIEESPHKYNHIYHVIDAADFPMSLIPRLNVLMGDVPLRSRNRRSRGGKFYKDRQTEMSFIITRSDLLGPTKEMVDTMMPYLREVLRDALGRVGGRIRLGNVRAVSARRSWWTREVREAIWARGGAGWMVGKVNVGKSQLFEAVYPKGRMTERKKTGTATVSVYPRDSVAAESMGRGESAETREEVRENNNDDDDYDLEEMDYGELLPPAQPATNYPEMPLVSSLPGTTASPIRIPFGNGRGELIDLPGLARSDLELFVQEKHRQSLIMKTRIVPEQISVTTGRSLILGGGLIRITPRTPNMVFLMYNFTPLGSHLTMTQKAVEFQTQTRRSVDIENITVPMEEGDAAETMKLAGTFKLRYDVTKKRAGPLTRKNAIGLQVDRLPFRVLSVDILIEGVGYVEVVAQVRARDVERFPQLDDEAAEQQVPEDSRRTGRRWEPRRRIAEQRSSSPSSSSSREDDDDPFLNKFNLRRDSFGDMPDKQDDGKAVARENELEWPSVDVFTPEGRFVGTRQPLQGWMNNKPRVLKEHKRSRPRRSMKGQKKKEKKLRREREAQGNT